MSYKTFLKKEKEKREASIDREKSLDKKDFHSLSNLPNIFFKVSYTESFGIGFIDDIGTLLFNLDEEDIEYFHNKACKLLEKEKQDKIDEINKQYDAVSDNCKTK